MNRLALVWPVPASAPTAAAIRLLGLERAAARIGVPTVTVLPHRLMTSSESDGAGEKKLRLYGSAGDGRRGFLPDLARLLPSTIQLVGALRGLKVSCVVASTPAPFLPFQSLMAARLLGIPYVLDVRDSWEMEAVTHEGPLRNRTKGWLERVCAKSADRVMCVTVGLRERLIEKYNLEDGKVSILTNGADRTLFYPGNDARDLDFIFLGSSARYRNVQGVLQGLAMVHSHVRHLSAWFVGWGDALGGEKVRSQAGELGLPATVRFVASVPHEETAPLLRRARLGIVSLSGEDVFRAAIGAKTYEYIASGVPLACLGPPGRSELRDLVESRLLGFYASSPDEFATRALELLGKPDRWAEMSRNCVNVSARFDRRVLSEKALKNIVLPLMSTGSGRARRGARE